MAAKRCSSGNRSFQRSTEGAVLPYKICTANIKVCLIAIPVVSPIHEWMYFTPCMSVHYRASTSTGTLCRWIVLGSNKGTIYFQIFSYFLERPLITRHSSALYTMSSEKHTVRQRDAIPTSQGEWVPYWHRVISQSSRRQRPTKSQISSKVNKNGSTFSFHSLSRMLTFIIF